MSGRIRVVIADDSAFMRKSIKEILERDGALQVVAAARNGHDAVECVKTHQPDVVTMDINMPVMDGVTALQIIMAESPRPVVMLSSLTQEGALATFECLELGAVDFIPKPSGTISMDLERVAREMVAKVKQAARARYRRGGPRPAIPRMVATAPPKPAPGAPADGLARRIVAIGVSTGGPKTLLDIVASLPACLDAAVVVVQHMPEAFTASFARRLGDSGPLPFKEAAAGEPIRTGQGYVARGGKHLVFARRPAGGVLARYSAWPDDVPHIPSVDVMMHSALEHFGPATLGVLLTGMGDDGADAMVAIRQAGGPTIAEDESTCIVFGMPAQAIQRGGAQYVLPCFDIAEKIASLVPTMPLASW
jgi:two-component system chemotaxis response regulator CheB